MDLIWELSFRHDIKRKVSLGNGCFYSNMHCVCYSYDWYKVMWVAPFLCWDIGGRGENGENLLNYIFNAHKNMLQILIWLFLSLILHLYAMLGAVRQLKLLVLGVVSSSDGRHSPACSPLIDFETPLLHPMCISPGRDMNSLMSSIGLLYILIWV